MVPPPIQHHIVNICSLLFVFSSLAFSQSQRRTLSAVRSTESISIDGKLTETLWQRAGTRGLIQRQPNEGAAASEETEIWVAYDDHALYIAARMYDSSPDSIVGRLARRDDDSESDNLSIGLDPALDRRTGYYFSVNPAGAILDGTFFNDTGNNGSWDGVWEAASAIDNQGWTAEFRIPFSQLRFPRKDRYVWGIEVARQIQRRKEESYLVLHARTDQVRVSRFSDLIGIEGIEPPERIEVLPYAAGTGKFVEQPPVDAFNNGRTDPFVWGRDYKANIGADAKIGLAGDVTLDLSLNPDFAQVEVDPAVVNLTAYETRYDEKRPFFIEGSHILNFGRGGAPSLNDFNWRDPNFFYSRRIGRAPQGDVTHSGFMNIPDRTTILGAAKVSGKIDNTWSIVALSAVTAREYGDVDSAGKRFSDEVEPLTFYGVIRTQKEFNQARQALGMVGTFAGRNLRGGRLQGLLNERAFSGAVDGWSFLDENKDWVVTGYAGGSYVEGSVARMLALQQSSQHYFQRPDAGHVHLDLNATSLRGYMTRVWIDKVRGNWIFDAAFGAISPGFETNDAGFLNFADYINTHLYIGYQWFDPDAVFRYKILTATALREYDFGGNRTGETYIASTELQFLNYWGGSLSLGYNAESFDNQRTRGGPLMKALSSQFLVASAYTDARGRMSGSLSFTGATGASGGWQTATTLSLSWKPSKTVGMSLSPSLVRVFQKAQYVTTQTDPLATETFGRRYIFGLLDQTQVSASLRMNWTFTPKLSLQLYAQPLLSTGSYNELKELAKPSTYSFNKYGEGTSSISFANDLYTVDPDGTLGPAQPFTFANPNFNYKSLRVNAVLRWEYSPGSTFYLVWTNEKLDYEVNGDFQLGRDFSTLLRDRPDNVVAVKMTYWWGR
jgi:hypothetical protein